MNESSFVPYQDSMHTSSSFRNAPGVKEAPPQVVPLQIPLQLSEQSISEQTFTQFDIGHPKEFEPISTPKFVHHQKGSHYFYLLACVILIVQVQT